MEEDLSSPSSSPAQPRLPSPNPVDTPPPPLPMPQATNSDVSAQPVTTNAQPLNTTPPVPTKPAVPQKRGNPGKFQGEHLVFLQARINGYLSLSVRHEKSQWIANLTHEWFEKYPWHTRTEPAEFAILRDSNATLSDEERLELETRRDELLTQTVKDGQKEILNWVHRQSQRSAKQEKGKTFVAISNQMSKGTRGAPRRKPNYKHFMSHPDHKAEFLAYYEEKTEGDRPSKSQRMAVQCRLAQELYEAQSEEVKVKIALENAESYSERFKAFKKLLSGQGFTLDAVDELTDAEKALCRASLTQFIQPLLDAIRAHTGLFLTLFVGAPPETNNDQFTLGTISSGSINGEKFQQWKAGKPLQNSIREFILFLNEALPEPLSIPLASTNATSSDLSHLINDNALHILPPESDIQAPSKRKLRRSRARNRNKTQNPDKGDESGDEDVEEGVDEKDEGDHGDEEDEEDEEEDEEDDEEQEDDDKDEDLPGLSAQRRSQLHPESLLQLRRLTGTERKNAIRRISLRMSKYEFDRENTILKNNYMMAMLFEGRSGTDIINGDLPNTSTPSSAPTDSVPPTTSAPSSTPTDTRDSSSDGVLPTTQNSSSESPTDGNLPTTQDSSSNPPQASNPNSITTTSDNANGVLPSTPSSAAPFDNPSAAQTDNPLPPMPSSTIPSSAAQPENQLLPDPSSNTDAVGVLENPLPPPESDNSMSTVDKSAWPKWVSDAYDALMAEHRPSDSLWDNTIKAWTDLERNYDFENPIGS
ncbi:hypothetical protein F5880DRAFT_1512196, partial [Lentinula raphanica]